MADKNAVSDEERTALEVGTVGWEASFVNGKPDWKDLQRISNIEEISEEERAFLDGPVEELCAMMDDWEIWESDEKKVTDKVMNFIKEKGFCGLVIPKEYGGLEFSEQAHSMIMKKLSSRSFAGAIIPMVINSLGAGQMILHDGTQEQKDHYLPKIASGEYITCFGATEPGAGSDLFGGMSTTGVIKLGDDGQPFIEITDIDKRYITLAPIADILPIAYILKDPDRILESQGLIDPAKYKEDGTIGMTVSLIHEGHPGLISGNRLRPNGIPFPNGTIKGDVNLDPDSVIGGIGKAGEHQRILQERLAVGRGISLPSVSAAAVKQAAYVTGAFAGTRVQFGRTLKDMELLEEPLAKMAGLAYLGEAVSTIAAKTVDDGGMPTVSSAIAKNHLVAMMEETLMDASRVLCGKGAMDGPGNPINRALQAIPVANAVEGAFYLTKAVIIGVQGNMRSHKHARHIFNALETKNVPALLGRGTAMVAETAYSYLKAGLPSVFHSGGYGDVDPKNVHYYRHINRLSKAYQMCTNVSIMHLQKGLMARGRTAGRLGDAMSYMYMAACVLSEFENKGRPEEQRDLLDWSVQYCLHKTEEALDDFTKNYPKKRSAKRIIDGREEKYTRPNRLMGSFMRAAVFPFYKITSRNWKPDDYLEHRVAQSIANPGPLRDLVTEGIYKPDDPKTEVMAALDDALVKWTNASNMVGAALREGRELTEDEEKMVVEARKAQAKIVAVDEFKPDAKTLLKPALDA